MHLKKLMSGPDVSLGWEGRWLHRGPWDSAWGCATEQKQPLWRRLGHDAQAANNSDVVFNEGYVANYAGLYASSRFCLAPHGAGFGVRLTMAMAHACIPGEVRKFGRAAVHAMQRALALLTARRARSGSKQQCSMHSALAPFATAACRPTRAWPLAPSLSARSDHPG
jgi:hypothetical protein